jgi:hypothetical protein
MARALVAFVVAACSHEDPSTVLPPRSTTTTTTTTTGVPHLDVTGYGPLRFGMTVQQAGDAVGATILTTPGGRPECVSGSYPGQPDGLDLYFLSGRLAVLQLHDTTTVPAVGGVAIGSAEADVRRAWGSHLAPGPASSEAGATELLYRSGDRAGRAYEVEADLRGGTVVLLTAGRREAVEADAFCS